MIEFITQKSNSLSSMSVCVYRVIENPVNVWFIDFCGLEVQVHLECHSN